MLYYSLCASVLCEAHTQTTADMMTSGGQPLTSGEITHGRCQAKANEEKLNSSWCFRSIFNKLWLMTVWFSSSITDQGSPAGAEKQLNQPNLFWQIHRGRKSYYPCNTHSLKKSTFKFLPKLLTRVMSTSISSIIGKGIIYSYSKVNPFSVTWTQRKVKGKSFLQQINKFWFDFKLIL